MASPLRLAGALKTVAFIVGKSENPAAQNFFIHFSIDNLIARSVFMH